MKEFIGHLKDRLQGKAAKGQRRSGKWPGVRKAYVEKYPECAVCRSTKKLQVHHKLPFHLFPDLELNEDNLITLCEHGKYKGINCHSFFGHLQNYRQFNPSVAADAAYWKEKIK